MSEEVIIGADGSETDVTPHAPHAPKPKFVPVDLTELVEAGVLMIANERLFWPLGLALTWYVEEDGSVSDLHVRQWEYHDGHRESISLDPEDEVGEQRRVAFDAWLTERVARMPEDEGARALRLRTRRRLRRELSVQ